MVYTTIGKSGLVLAIGSFSTNRPQYMAIGSGSGTVAVTNVELLGEESRKIFTSGSIDAIGHEIEFVADWNSVEMSGIGLKEFGAFTESAATTGSLWDREGFSEVGFDGTNELQIQLTWEVY